MFKKCKFLNLEATFEYITSISYKKVTTHTMNSLWYFNDVNLYNILCPHKFKKYKKSHEFDAYKKQDYIYFEEDSANKVYLIDKGKVKLGYYTESGEEVVKSILSKGELFGEKAILGEEKRNEFAQSVDNATSICPISVDTLHDLMRQPNVHIKDL